MLRQILKNKDTNTLTDTGKKIWKPLVGFLFYSYICITITNKLKKQQQWKKN